MDRYDIALKNATAAGFQAPVCPVCDGLRMVEDGKSDCGYPEGKYCSNCDGTGTDSPEVVCVEVVLNLGSIRYSIIQCPCRVRARMNSDINSIALQVTSWRMHDNTPRDFAAALLECLVEVKRG